MTSIDEILFDQDLPCSITTSNKLRNIIISKFGNIKCFKLRPQYQRFSPLREVIFTKYGVGSAYTGNFFEFQFSNSFLFGIKCILNNEFNFDLYNKYKDAISAQDNNSFIDEKNTLLLEKKYLQKKYSDLEKKLKEEQHKNEVLVELYQSQLHNKSNNNTDSKYIELQKMFNEQSKQMYNLKFKIEELECNYCIICYETCETNYISVPCNHVCKIHMSCLVRATRCPICNQDTVTREQVYLST